MIFQDLIVSASFKMGFLSEDSLQHPYFWLFVEKALHIAAEASKVAQSADVSLEW